MDTHIAVLSRSRPWSLAPRGCALRPTVSSSEPGPQASVLKGEIIVHKVAHVSPLDTLDGQPLSDQSTYSLVRSNGS